MKLEEINKNQAEKISNLTSTNLTQQQKISSQNQQITDLNKTTKKLQRSFFKNSNKKDNLSNIQKQQ